MKHKHADLIHSWADGAKIEVKINGRDDWREANNPLWLLDSIYRIKPKIVKQVLWVKAAHKSGINRMWLDVEKKSYLDGWHKVPTCTREV